MAMPTRLTTRRSVRFLRATIGAYIIVACCGLILLSAVSAYAGRTPQGLQVQGIRMQGMLINSTSSNGSYNKFQYRSKTSPSVQNEHLPWATLSHKALGKSFQNIP